MKVSLNLKASYFEIIDTLYSEFSHRFPDFDMSLIKSLRVLSPASNYLLDKDRVTTFLLLGQFNYQKYQ